MKTTSVLTILAALAFTAAPAVHGRPGGRAGDRRPGPPAAPHKSPGATQLRKPQSPGGAQQQNIQKLQSDLAAIKAGSQVTDAQKQALAADLKGIASRATKPSQQSVQQLTNDLSKAVADGNLSQQEKMQLAKDVSTVMNSANISKDDVNKAIADARVILTASGVDQADVQLIVADLKAIAATAQASVR